MVAYDGNGKSPSPVHSKAIYEVSQWRICLCELKHHWTSLVLRLAHFDILAKNLAINRRYVFPHPELHVFFLNMMKRNMSESSFGCKTFDPKNTHHGALQKTSRRSDRSEPVASCILLMALSHHERFNLVFHSLSACCFWPQLCI